MLDWECSLAAELDATHAIARDIQRPSDLALRQAPRDTGGPQLIADCHGRALPDTRNLVERSNTARHLARIVTTAYSRLIGNARFASGVHNFCTRGREARVSERRKGRRATTKGASTQMRGFGFLGAVGFLILLLIAGAIGFGLGQGAPAAVPVAGAPVVYYGHPGWGGFGFLGFFLFIILVFVVIGLLRRAAWGGHGGWGKHGYGMHGYGNASWGDKPVPPFADEMLQRWHRQAHGEPTPTDTSGGKPDNDPNRPA
jgi:hypothetical protein